MSQLYQIVRLLGRLCLIVLVIRQLTGSQCPDPPGSPVTVDSRCLWTGPGGNMTEGEDSCGEYSGNLFSFSSMAELEQLLTLVNFSDPEESEVYIGAIRAHEKGSPGTYYDWLVRPDTPCLLNGNVTIVDSSDPAKACVKIAKRKLFAENCSVVMATSICEREISSNCTCDASDPEATKDPDMSAMASPGQSTNGSNLQESWHKDSMKMNVTDILSHVLNQIGKPTNGNQGAATTTEMPGTTSVTSPSLHLTTAMVPSTTTTKAGHGHHGRGSGHRAENAGCANNTTGASCPIKDIHFIAGPLPGQQTVGGPTLLIDKYSATDSMLQGTSSALKTLMSQPATNRSLESLSTTVAHSLGSQAKTSVAAEMQEDLFSDIMLVAERLLTSVGSSDVTLCLTNDTIDVLSSLVQPVIGADDKHVEVKLTPDNQDSSPKLKLSADIFNTTRGVRVSTIVYKTARPRLKAKDMSIASKVVSVSVQYQTGNKTVKPSISLSDVIILELETTVESSRGEKSRHCTYWDFDTRYRVYVAACVTNRKWSDNGCRVLGKNTSHTCCVCDHLTNFAVLVMYMDGLQIPLHHQQALLTLTTVGCSLSIACLAMTLIAYIYLKVLGNEKIMIHANLALALMMAQLVFVSSSDAHNNKVACKAVALLLHFLFMAAFTWMLVEGIALYLYCTRGIFNQKDMRVKYFLLGWGLPMIIVLVSFAAQFPHYGDGPQFSCWLSVQNGLIWAFLGPIIVIILLNMFVLGLVVRVFLALKTNTQKSNAARFRGSVRAMLFLLPLLGLTWLLSLLVPFSVVFHYLFVITNTTQGMLIFFLHCVCNEEIRKKFQAKRRRWSSTARTGSDNDSSYSTRRNKRGSFDAIKATVTAGDCGRAPVNTLSGVRAAWA